MKLLRWCKANAMPVIAVLAAAVTAVFVPPDAAYLGYYDVKTLSCLLCVLAVVGALRRVGLFPLLAQRLVQVFHTTRGAVTALVGITLVGSMLLTNDTALLTFLPLSWFVLERTGQTKWTALTFILQNCAANLGGMLTPFGNPQNLYLFNHYNIPNGEFLSIMLPPFLLSTALILLCCLFLPREGLTVPRQETLPDKRRTAVYGVLFCVAVAMVLRGIPYWLGLLVIVMALLVLDRRALLGVDWGLLVTFAAFFTFSGNMARIEPVRELFRKLLTHGAMPVAALTSQVISNVPAAILLSRFTDDYRGLLVLESAGLFDILADAGMLVLHSAYIVTRQGEGILFSGPSGIGKSTQAALWQRYGAAQTVNGDRALVRPDTRTVSGVMYAGTSGICRNVTAPLRAVVLLHQAPESRVTDIRPQEAFARVLSQCAYHQWDPASAARMTELAARLVTNIPVRQLDCRADESAVRALEEALRRT